MLGLSTSAFALPVLLGEVFRDYGSGEGKVTPVQSIPGNLFDDHVKIQTPNTSFYDEFDFSSIEYTSVSYFEIFLDYGNVSGIWWYIWPGSSRSVAIIGAQIYMSSFRLFQGQSSFTLNANNISSNDVYRDIVYNEIFGLRFAYRFPGNPSFDLYSATLRVFGEPSSQPLNPIPEPGTIALLGIGLAGLGLYGYRRKNKI
ncbi:MAG: PEP-CTERM sorting domain-containing protein [Desulfovibrionales bacterium]|nr:MAG: PEP-CTERM sorting domain-containing protein [Desulfovibrionales bacterium]